MPPTILSCCSCPVHGRTFTGVHINMREGLFGPRWRSRSLFGSTSLVLTGAAPAFADTSKAPARSHRPVTSWWTSFTSASSIERSGNSKIVATDYDGRSSGPAAICRASSGSPLSADSGAARRGRQRRRLDRLHRDKDVHRDRPSTRPAKTPTRRSSPSPVASSGSATPGRPSTAAGPATAPAKGTHRLDWSWPVTRLRCSSTRTRTRRGWAPRDSPPHRRASDVLAAGDPVYVGGTGRHLRRIQRHASTHRSQVRHERPHQRPRVDPRRQADSSRRGPAGTTSLEDPEPVRGRDLPHRVLRQRRGRRRRWHGRGRQRRDLQPGRARLHARLDDRPVRKFDFPNTGNASGADTLAEGGSRLGAEPRPPLRRDKQLQQSVLASRADRSHQADHAGPDTSPTCRYRRPSTSSSTASTSGCSSAIARTSKIVATDYSGKVIGIRREPARRARARAVRRLQPPLRGRTRRRLHRLHRHRHRHRDRPLPDRRRHRPEHVAVAGGKIWFGYGDDGRAATSAPWTSPATSPRSTLAQDALRMVPAPPRLAAAPGDPNPARRRSTASSGNARRIRRVHRHRARTAVRHQPGGTGGPRAHPGRQPPRHRQLR